MEPKPNSRDSNNFWAGRYLHAFRPSAERFKAAGGRFGEIKKPGPSSEQSHRESKPQLHDSKPRINSKLDTRAGTFRDFELRPIVRTECAVRWDTDEAVVVDVHNMRFYRIFCICGFHVRLNPAYNAPRRLVR